MKLKEIDRLIECYAAERRHEPRQVAERHFLTRAYLVCRGDELGEFMSRMRNWLVYRIDSLSLFDNPFRNTQLFWLFFMFLWFCFSIYLLTDENYRMVGMINGAGTVIFGSSLWKMIWTRWLDTSLLIAYYREIIELIDSQLPFSDTVPAA